MKLNIYSILNIKSQPSNPYCKANFIDYNHLVDKILSMSSSYTKANASSPKNTNNITTSQVKESIDWSLLKEIKYNVERTKKNIEDCYTAGKNCNSSEIIKLSKNFKKENSPTKFIRQLNDEQKNCKF